MPIKIYPLSVEVEFSIYGAVCISITAFAFYCQKIRDENILQRLQLTVEKDYLWEFSSYKDPQTKPFKVEPKEEPFKVKHGAYFLTQFETFRFYFWPKVLFDNFQSVKEINEKIEFAQDYLNLTRDEIWQKSLLSFAQVMWCSAFDFLPLINPAPYGIKFKDESKNGISEFQSRQIIFLENKIVEKKSVEIFNTSIEQLQESLKEAWFDSQNESFIDFSPFEVWPGSLSSNSNNQYKMEQIYLKMMENCLTRFKNNVASSQAIQQCDEKVHNSLFSPELLKHLPKQLEPAKIKLLDLLGYELQYVSRPNVRLLTTFYFATQQSAERFAEQFKEKFVPKSFMNDDHNCSEPYQKGRYWVVDCWDHCSTTTFQMSSACYNRRINPIDFVQKLEAVDFFQKQWQPILKIWSNYFAIPGIDLIIENPMYHLSFHEHMIQVRLDLCYSPENIIILRLYPPAELEMNSHFLNLKWSGNSEFLKIKVPIEVKVYWEGRQQTPLKTWKINASYEDNIFLSGNATPYLPYNFSCDFTKVISFNRNSEVMLPKSLPIAPSPVSSYSTEGEWSKDRRIFSIPPKFPILQNVSWPYQRGLLIPQTDFTLNDRRRLALNCYLKRLKTDAKVVEFGAGAGQVSAYTKKLYPQICMIAAGVTPLIKENEELCDQVYYGPVPDSLMMLKQHINSADLVIDVFGAGTYANNPLHSIIYAAFILKVSGRYEAIISGLPFSYDASPLGDGKNRQEIRQFFLTEFGIDLRIEKTKVLSEVQKGRIVEDFYVTFEKNKNFNFISSIETFLQSCQKVDEQIGIPQVVEVTDDFGKFEAGQTITTKIYVKPLPKLGLSLALESHGIHGKRKRDESNDNFEESNTHKNFFS